MRRAVLAHGRPAGALGRLWFKELPIPRFPASDTSWAAAARRAAHAARSSRDHSRSFSHACSRLPVPQASWCDDLFSKHVLSTAVRRHDTSKPAKPATSRLTSRVVARCAAGEAGRLRLVLGDSGGGAQPSGLPVRVRGRWVLCRGAPLPPAVGRVAWSGVCAPVIGRGWCCVARGGRRPTRGRYSRVRAR